MSFRAWQSVGPQGYGAKIDVFVIAQSTGISSGWTQGELRNVHVESTESEVGAAMARHDVDTIDQQVMRLFAMVSEGLLRATEAFLDTDREEASALLMGEQSIDLLHASTEVLVERELAHNLRWTDSEVRHLIAVLRIIPELERSGDLVEHIALRSSQGLARHITPRGRGLVSEMGRTGAEMWRDAATAYADQDPTAADRLRARDDQLDDLHVELSVELTSNDTSIAVAIEMGLVARFYERLGDHAVNVARRVQHVAPAVSVLSDDSDRRAGLRTGCGADRDRRQ